MRHFTIRDLLWLTAVVALGAAWRIDRGRRDQKLVETQAELHEIRKSEAWHWRDTATRLAEFMREGGWFVALDKDGSGFSATNPVDHPFHSLRIGDAVDDCLDVCSRSADPRAALKSFAAEAKTKGELKERELKMVTDIVLRILQDREERR